MKYYFPIHLDGGNRGCEAIAKGTAAILQEKKENLVGLCRNIEVDTRLKVNECVTLVPMCTNSLIFKVFFKFYRIVIRNHEKQQNMFFKYAYAPFVNRITRKDILVSTGGDMMCYENNEVNYTVNLAKKKGIESILWGCSIGEENLTKEKLEALHNFSVVYARETLTEELLHKHGINNVVVFPDPAFVLKPEICILPECLSSSEVVGLNISNFVIGGFELDSPFAKEIIKMVEYVLAETKLHILLIPHVMWEDQDDRIVSRKLKNYFCSDRIDILDSEKLNYCQIRYVISKCKMFVGARTHAVISAYSICVPALALGYSVKSKGIAKDVGMPDWSVVNCKNINEDALVAAFRRLMENETYLRSLLRSNIPSYKDQLSTLRNKIISI